MVPRVALHDAIHAFEQVEIVALVRCGCGGQYEAGILRVAGGADAWFAVEGIDFEAGVVGEDAALDVEAVVLGFETGIASEGGLIFFGSGDGWEVGQRLDQNAAVGRGDGEVAELAGVGGSGVEGERHEVQVTGFGFQVWI